MSGHYSITERIPALADVESKLGRCLEVVFDIREFDEL